MKEQYYTPQNIKAKAQEFLDELMLFRVRHPLQLDLPKAALLVIDAQDFFLQSTSHAFIPSMPAIIPNIKKMQDFFLRKKLPVVQTRHANNAYNGANMLKWWKNILAIDDPLGNVVAELRDPVIPIMVKPQNDAFIDSELLPYLQKLKVTQLIISGVMTHLCCETTARSAFMRGFEVYFVIDATATYNQNFHRSTLYNLSHGFAVPLLTAEIF